MSAVYNNVENITKEAVELNNSYSSKSSSFGVNAGAAIGYGHKMQATGNGGSVSLGRSSQNTVETVYHNGSFANVNEVHNNTGTMIVSGFNQETRDKEGTARNTVTRNATTKETAGDTVNRDMSRANEITKDKSSTVNVNVESQTIQYAANPSKFKEEGKAKDETRDIGRATNEYFKDKYKDDSTRITLTSEGAIDTSKLGTNVGDDVIVPQKYWGVNNFPAADNKKKVKSSFEEVYNKLYKKK